MENALTESNWNKWSMKNWNRLSTTKKENNMHSGWKFWIQQRMIHEPSKGQEIIENICPPGIRTLSFAVVDNYRRAFYPNKKWHPPQKNCHNWKKMIQSLHINCLQSIFDSVMILPMHLLMVVAKMMSIFFCYDLIISNWNRLQRLMPSSHANQTSSIQTVILELCFIFFFKREIN